MRDLIAVLDLVDTGAHAVFWLLACVGAALVVVLLWTLAAGRIARARYQRRERAWVRAIVLAASQARAEVDDLEALYRAPAAKKGGRGQ